MCAAAMMIPSLEQLPSLDAIFDQEAQQLDWIDADQEILNLRSELNVYTARSKFFKEHEKARYLAFVDELEKRLDRLTARSNARKRAGWGAVVVAAVLLAALGAPYVGNSSMVLQDHCANPVWAVALGTWGPRIVKLCNV